MAELLTAAEVAARLRVSVAAVNRYAREGVIPSIQLVPGGPRRFRAADLDSLLLPSAPTGDVA